MTRRALQVGKNSVQIIHAAVHFVQSVLLTDKPEKEDTHYLVMDLARPWKLVVQLWSLREHLVM